MKILNTDLPDLNIADVDVLEKYENVVQAVTDKANSKKSFEKSSQQIRFLCTAVFEAFDELFGNGTAKKIFGEKTDLNECVEAYSQLISEVQRIDKRNANIIKNKFTGNSPKPTFNGKKKKHRGYRK